MIFTKLTWKNLFSYGDDWSEINLNQDGIIFVRGVNRDTNTSNGSGKSSIIDVFIWALYGNTLKKMKIDDIKNKHSDEAGEARVEFWLDEDYYEIVRYRGDKKHANNVIIKINNELLEFGTNRDAQKYIDDTLGLDYSAFVSTHTFSSEVPFEFPTITADRRRETLEQVLGLQAYSEYGKIAKSMVKEVKAELSDFEIELREKKAFLKNENNDYEDYKNREGSFDTEQEKKLAELEENLKKIDRAIDACDIERRNRLSKEEDNLSDLIRQGQEELHTKEVKLSAITAELKSLKRDLDDINSEAKKENRSLSMELDSFVTLINKKIKLMECECPTCEREWEKTEVEQITKSLLEDKKNKEKEIQIQIDIVEETSAKKKLVIEGAIDSKKNKRNKISNEIEEYSKAITDAKSRMSAISDEKATLPSQEQIDNLIKRKNSAENELDSEKNKANPYTEVVQNLRKKIEGLVDEIDVLGTEKTEKEEELKYLSFWNESFNTDGLKLFIFESIIPIMNGRIAHYVPLLFDGKEISLEFDKLMNMKIIKEGKEISYGACSQGERKRLDLAMALGLLETAQAQHGATSNVMFFDELMDSSLDEQGLRAVTEILHTMPVETIFLISHRTEISNDFDNILDVVKEGQYSQILTS